MGAPGDGDLDGLHGPDGPDGPDGTDDPERAGEDARAVIGLERALLDPQVRHQPDLVRSMLHPDFVEFGASGQVWDADSVVALLAAEPDSGGEPMSATDFRAVVLAPGVLLLTFRTDRGSVGCVRSSVWVCSTGQVWQLRFHQATVLPQAANDD